MARERNQSLNSNIYFGVGPIALLVFAALQRQAGNRQKLPMDLQFLAAFRPSVAFAIPGDMSQQFRARLRDLEFEERKVSGTYRPESESVQVLLRESASVKRELGTPVSDLRKLSFRFDFNDPKETIEAGMWPHLRYPIKVDGSFVLVSGSFGRLRGGAGLPKGVACRITIFELSNRFVTGHP